MGALPLDALHLAFSPDLWDTVNSILAATVALELPIQVVDKFLLADDDHWC